MMEPSLDKLMNKVDSRYVLVVAAAKRARQIEAANGRTVERDVDDDTLPPIGLLDKDKSGRVEKSVTRALKDIMEGKIVINWGKSEAGEQRKVKADETTN